MKKSKSFGRFISYVFLNQLINAISINHNLMIHRLTDFNELVFLA